MIAHRVSRCRPLQAPRAIPVTAGAPWVLHAPPSRPGGAVHADAQMTGQRAHAYRPARHLRPDGPRTSSTSRAIRARSAAVTSPAVAGEVGEQALEVHAHVGPAPHRATTAPCRRRPRRAGPRPATTSAAGPPPRPARSAATAAVGPPSHHRACSCAPHLVVAGPGRLAAELVEVRPGLRPDAVHDPQVDLLDAGRVPRRGRLLGQGPHEHAPPSDHRPLDPVHDGGTDQRPPPVDEDLGPTGVVVEGHGVRRLRGSRGSRRRRPPPRCGPGTRPAPPARCGRRRTAGRPGRGRPRRARRRRRPRCDRPHRRR